MKVPAVMVLVFVMLFGGFSFAEEPLMPVENQAVENNGPVTKPLSFELEPFKVQGVLIGPAREIARGLGFKVASKGKEIILVKDDSTLSIKVGSKVANLNGKEIAMPRRAILIGQTTFVPMRTITEAFGLGLDFDSKHHLLGIGDVYWKLSNRKRAIVDKDRQWLYIYKGVSLIFDCRTVTGKKGYETPAGIYCVTRKISGWHEVVGKEWTGWMFYPVYFSAPGDYAFHGSTSMPRKGRASHGCCRVSVRKHHGTTNAQIVHGLMKKKDGVYVINYL